jgi:hypothetical protein
MLDGQARYAPNVEEVAAKVIDGELIIIRLVDGTYYSTANVGPHVWELLDARLGIADVVRTISEWYSTAETQVEKDVTAFVQELIGEDLIVASHGGESALNPPPRPADLQAYETPEIHTYRDMGNLLALDPPTPGIDDLLLREERNA